MDARGRWQALQARLTAARSAVEAGDRATALREVNTALAIDKDYLAAQALRDQIMSMSDAPTSAGRVGSVQPPRLMPVPARIAPVPTVAPPAAAIASFTDVAHPSVIPHTDIQPAAVPQLAAVRPADELPATPPAYAKFEQRAKRRRVDRRIDAARLALDQKRLKAAAAALDEVIELDPNQPELAELTARFDDLRRATATHHRGPWIAAAAVFVAALLAGSWLQDSSRIVSRQTVTAGPLLEPVTPTLPVTERLAVAATAGERDEPEPVDIVEKTVTAPPPPVAYAVHVPEAPAAMPAPIPVRASAQPDELPPPVHVPEVVHAVEPINRAPSNTAMLALEVPPLPPPAPAAAVSAPIVVPPDENNAVKQALQRYRSAYRGTRRTVRAGGVAGRE